MQHRSFSTHPKLSDILIFENLQYIFFSLQEVTNIFSLASQCARFRLNKQHCNNDDLHWYWKLLILTSLMRTFYLGKLSCKIVIEGPNMFISGSQ